MARWDRLDPAAISRMLAERAEALVQELLPAGKRVGPLWRVGSLAGEQGQSLCVYLHGPRLGNFKDFASGEFGDMLDLVAALRGGDLKRGIEWSLDWLGLGDLGKEERRRRQQQAERRAVAAVRDKAQQRIDNRRRAIKIWEAEKPLSRGDLVDQYLQSRGLDLAQLGRAPQALRFAPSLWAGPDQYLPAMLGAITDPAGNVVGVHRTYLSQRADGSVGKAAIAAEKRALGDCMGNCIRLWRGASGRSWQMMRPCETVMVSEGIEDLLAAIVIAEIVLELEKGRSAIVPAADLRGVVAVSLSLMPLIVMGPQVETIVILAQRDDEGSPAARQLRRAVETFRAQGRRVLLVPPPRWPGLKDVADLAARVQRAPALIA